MIWGLFTGFSNVRSTNHPPLHRSYIFSCWINDLSLYCYWINNLHLLWLLDRWSKVSPSLDLFQAILSTVLINWCTFTIRSMVHCFPYSWRDEDIFEIHVLRLFCRWINELKFYNQWKQKQKPRLELDLFDSDIINGLDMSCQSLSKPGPLICQRPNSWDPCCFRDGSIT